MSKTRVLFVCLGNICRSPLAEAIFKNKIQIKGLADLIEADSCGTSNYHIGDSPDPRTLTNATRNGISIEHFGRQFSSNDFENFDFIMAMDKSNYRNILSVNGSESHASKVMLMRSFDPLDRNGEVPDPYHGGEDGFQHVFEILDRTMDEFILHLEQQVIKRSELN